MATWDSLLYEARIRKNREQEMSDPFKSTRPTAQEMMRNIRMAPADINDPFGGQTVTIPTQAPPPEIVRLEQSVKEIIDYGR